MITIDQIEAIIAKINLGDVVWAEAGNGVLHSPTHNAYEVRFILPKEGLYTAVLVPPDAAIELVDVDINGAVVGLRRLSTSFKANKYEPEVGGPSFSSWMAERELWMAEAERRAPTIDFDALAEVRREIVEMVDRVKCAVQLRCQICNRVTEGPYDVQAAHDVAPHQRWRAARAEARAAEEAES